MRYSLSVLLIGFTFLFSLEAKSWGMLGHRVVGEIASKHLNETAKNKLQAILGHQTLAEISTWMDDIKSDKKYDSLRPWHYVTIPNEMKYDQTNINPKGDAIYGVNYVVDALKKGELSPELEKEYLMILVHLVGDIHQPLHVGNGKDVGGNKVKLSWFGKSTNLHSIWDSEIIDGKKYSYTELTSIINHPNNTEVEKWQSSTAEDWAHECMQFREGIYTYKNGYNWEYKYQYKHWGILKNQLLKGGVRLAGVLNEIYG